MKKILIIIILWGILSPNFSFAQAPQITGPPETIDQLKNIGEKTIPTIIKELPNILKNIWQKEMMPIFQTIWNWLKNNIWDPYIGYRLQNIWQDIQNIFEKRKPDVEKEFQKEKQEIKTELPGTLKSLWETIKNFIR